MQLPSAATPTPSAAAAAAYAKVDKMDAEEARHLKAQYLIQKVLEEATTAPTRPPRRRPPVLARVKARIGVRLKKLRVAIRGVRARARRAVRRHLSNLRRIIVRGGQGSVQPAAPGSGSPPS